MKKTGFFRLCIRSLPEIWFCQAVIGAILWFPMTALNTVVTTIASSGDFAVTTANCFPYLTTPHRNAWQSERCGVYKRRHLETHIKHSFKTLYFDQ